MNGDIKTLVKSHDICVLATASGERPYCSLMAYVADSDCSTIYMVTKRESRKYLNLISNPNVSLLIDTRTSTPRTETKAMTIEGVARPVSDPVLVKNILKRIVSAHPHMSDFVSDPEAAVVAIRPKAFLLLDGLTKSYFERIE